MNRTCAARTNGTLKAVAQSNSGPCGNALCHSWPLVNRVFTLVSIMQWATFSKDVAAPTGIIAQCAARRQHGQYGWETLLLANRLHRRASAGSTTTPLQLTRENGSDGHKQGSVHGTQYAIVSHQVSSIVHFGGNGKGHHWVWSYKIRSLSWCRSRLH